MKDKIVHSRGVGWFDPEQHVGRGVTLVGAGGIGSFVALGLAKMFGPNGPSLTIIDPDKIEGHNIPNQLYTHTQLGTPKVTALEMLCDLFGGVQPLTWVQKVEQVPGHLNDIVVTGLDNMTTRYWVWDQMKNKVNCTRLIDGRLLGQYITVYSIDPKDAAAQQYYESPTVKFTDEEMEIGECTERSIIDVAFHVAAHIQTAVRKTLTQQRQPHTLIHDVAAGSFTTAYDLAPVKKVRAA